MIATADRSVDASLYQGRATSGGSLQAARYAAGVFAVFVVALSIRWIRVDHGPDVLSDELQYSEIARHFVSTGRFTDFYGVHQLGYFYTHPPLFFALAGGFGKITGVENLRYYSGLVGALTAVQLCLLGRLLSGRRRIGLLAGLLFALSPIAVRTDRMVMIEATASYLTVLFVYLITRGLHGKKWVVGAGLVFGAMLLTKELLLFMLLVLLALAVIYRRRLAWKHVLVVVGIGVACYMTYFGVEAATGFQKLWAVKGLSIQRALGAKVTTGYSLPRYPSPFADIRSRILEWAPDIIMGLIVLAGCARYLRSRRDAETVTATWLIATAGFLLAAHIYNFQFVAYLVPPAALGAALVLGRFSVRGHGYRAAKAGVLAALLVWSTSAVGYRYVATDDRAMTEAAHWIDKNVPVEAKLYAPVEFQWLTPGHVSVNPYYFPSLKSFKEQDLRWVVISPRTSYMLDLDTLAYVKRYGQLEAHFKGITSRGVSIYLVVPPASEDR